MVGERVLDRFVIEARLGGGGFGQVYRAWDERLDRPVAVKVVDRAKASAQRGAREAQAAARLAHRGIATLYELAETEDRTILVCELVEGETLAALAARGELSDRALATIGAEAAAALAHAHRHHVVHRDIKPQNVMVPAGTAAAKIVDFGVARICDSPTLTRTGAVVGTIAYMAPEQAEGQRAGPAADVFSLALTIYECLSGHHPHLRDGPAATARAIGEPVTPLGELRSDLPEELTDAIDAALDPDPELRPLASELESSLLRARPELGGDPLPPLLVAQLEAGEPLPVPAARVPPEAVALAAGAGVAALTWAAGDGPGVALAAAPVAGLLCMRSPGPGILIGGTGIAIAAASTVGFGAAALVAAAAIMLAAAASPAGRGALLACLAPLFALLSVSVAFPVLAAGPARWQARAAAGAAGAGLLILAALAGAGVPAPPQGAEVVWHQGAGGALSGALTALLDPASLLLAATWAAGAAVLPIVVRGRMPLLDALGVIVWAAAVVTLTRSALDPGAAGAAPAVIALVAGFSYAVAINPALRPGLSRPPAAGPRERSPMGLSA